MTTIDKSLGVKLRELRAARSWSQDDVATAACQLGASWTRSVVAALERGERRLYAVELPIVCTVFGCAWQNVVPAIRVPGFVYSRATLAVSRALKLDPEVVHLAAVRRWGRELSAERDQRDSRIANPRTSSRSRQALRAHATRQLVAELKTEIVA